MLQNRAIPSSISSPAPTELTGSLDRALTAERLRVILRTVSLPDTPRSFVVFLFMLLLFCGALACHLMLSTAIHENELRLGELKAINRTIEQETTTIIEEIANASSLTEGMERVRAMGYEAAYEHRYILQTTVPTNRAEVATNSPAPVVIQSAYSAAQN